MTFRLNAGTSKTIHFHLGRGARSRVNGSGSRGLAVSLTATVKDANAISVRTTVATTLKRARR